MSRPPFSSSPGGPIFILNPWNSWYFGGYGYNSRYNCGGWCYSNWGYDPFWYDPFYRYNRYYPYYPGDPYGAYGDPDYSTSSRDTEERRAVGSLRIKANQADAKVYIDGVLVGIVDDFDGMSNHLELDAGPHQMELRADGFQPLVVDVNVREGRTMTERVTLKKVK